MPTINHNVDISIYTMVRNRLPFIADTPANTTTISNFTLEIMWELEPCFKVGVPDPTKIGHEENYTVPMRTIIADIVSIYILILTAALNSGSSSSSSGTTFLERAKAGSVEVQYGQLNVNTSVMLNMNTPGLIEFFKRSAIRRARKLGCIIDICDDCSIGIESMTKGLIPPFITGSGNCNGCN